MGIKDLSKVIADHAPSAIKLNEIKNYFTRSVAIDASMSIYQFLIAVRQDGGQQLQNDQGETTSHLVGMFYRTIRMIENGIKPVYVFDGKPPEMKSEELQKRRQRREDTEVQLNVAQEAGNAEEVEKLERRLVKVSPEHNDECKRLLRLMGVPVVDAPCEAEAQCAALAKNGLVWAVGTEDMDALTFGTPILLRHLTFSEAKKMPIKEFVLDRVLKEMELNREEFVDLCILLGCDYCPSIRGIGPKKAVELIKKHKTIESILENLDPKKYPPPPNWSFAQARRLFLEPDVEINEETKKTITWKEPDVDGVVQFLCTEKGFSEDRIRASCAKLARSRASGQQGRIDSFFKIDRVVSSTTQPATGAQKRKPGAETEKSGKATAGAKKKGGPPPKRAK